MKAQVRYSERTDYKRCQKKWYWRWRKGMRVRNPRPSALDLGTWFHYGLENWYGSGTKRNRTLRWHVETAIETQRDLGVPEQHQEKFEELAMLVEAMADAYEKKYGRDSKVSVLATEIPLEFTFTTGTHRLKPDMVVQMLDTGLYYLWENKTAGQISIEHLPIDDQARGYAAMAERGLIEAGVLPRGKRLSGIMYNIVRKALSDERPQNEKGEYLNKDGSVSKKQPAEQFLRHPFPMTNRAKVIALTRVANEVERIVSHTSRLKVGREDPLWIQKTPHRSCPRFCDFFPICNAEEQGSDIRQMSDDLYIVADPYQYDQDTTSERISWEL